MKVDMHNHDEDSKASLHRQILNNYFQRKPLGDLYERPRRLIRKELQI
jgi:hypothetical protein